MGIFYFRFSYKEKCLFREGVSMALKLELLKLFCPHTEMDVRKSEFNNQPISSSK